jgi:hypothetical protein
MSYVLSMHCSGGGLSRGRSVVLLPLGGDGGYCSSMERLEVLLSMVGKTVEVEDGGGGGWR